MLCPIDNAQTCSDRHSFSENVSRAAVFQVVAVIERRKLDEHRSFCYDRLARNQELALYSTHVSSKVRFKVAHVLRGLTVASGGKLCASALGLA